MKHFVLTRLNCRCGIRQLEEDYMNYRINLFAITTYKSLLNQTDKNFTHILCVDPNVPNNIKEKTESFKNCKVMYINTEDKEWHWEEIAKRLREEYPEGKIVTTNIDSDDMIRNDYIERINKLAEYGKMMTPALFYSTSFYNLSVEKGINKIKPPFCPSVLSYIEHAKEIKTVWRRGHTEMPNEAVTIMGIEGCPFIMTTHPTNFCSRFFEPWIIERKLDINYEEYGINKDNIETFLKLKLPKQFVKRESNYRNLRRSKINKNKTLLRK